MTRSDPLKGKVYDAEYELQFVLTNGGMIELFGSKLTVPQERKFGDIEGVRRYVNKVCEFIGFDRPPTVRPRRGNTQAHYELYANMIAVPDHVGSQHSWAMRETVVLHELAHAMTPAHQHDEVFCAKLVELVSKVIAPEAGFLLAAAYGERGITVKAS